MCLGRFASDGSFGAIPASLMADTPRHDHAIRPFPAVLTLMSSSALVIAMGSLNTPTCAGCHETASSSAAVCWPGAAPCRRHAALLFCSSLLTATAKSGTVGVTASSLATLPFAATQLSWPTLARRQPVRACSLELAGWHAVLHEVCASQSVDVGEVCPTAP